MKRQPKMKSKTRQLNLFVDERSLFEKLCDLSSLEAGFKAVKKNGGSPGIDGVTIQDFESRLEEELVQLLGEIGSWTYKPNPVRRVEIPKPGKGAGVRLLGIPCVRDRVFQATIKQLLEPILDLTFSDDHSYGFRPGYSQRQAVEAAQRIVKSGKEYVVDIDLSKFFDRVTDTPHVDISVKYFITGTSDGMFCVIVIKLFSNRYYNEDSSSTSNIQQQSFVSFRLG